MLKRLTDAFGFSGYEAQVRNIIMEEIKDCDVDVSVDSMGNLVVFKLADENPDAKTVMFAAHMDEVGFIVTDITDEGYIKFDCVGGVEPKVMISQRVMINGHCGVVGLKPIHLTTKEERQSTPSMDELFADIGAKSRAEAEELVQKGDYFGFDSDYREFGNRIKAKAIDDRLGCLFMIEILKRKWNVNVVCAFTVQEEVGLRGIKPAARGINPDYAVVLEVTSCNDITGVPENLRVTTMGKGPALTLLDSACKTNGELVELLACAAESRNIPWQFKASTAGGNDSGNLCLVDGGIKTASVSVPCRYFHSASCVVDKRDIDACRKLLCGFLEDAGRSDR
ncbi:MAG: M42 family metallopeptidase [Clostridia bacterium]|nr:M42 family metallopeptidase [Clostridia bacterium]